MDRPTDGPTDRCSVVSIDDDDDYGGGVGGGVGSLEWTRSQYMILKRVAMEIFFYDTFTITSAFSD